MKNLEVYREEIFRRSRERLQKRRARRRALLLCIPLLVLLTVLLIRLPEPEVTEAAPAESDGATGTVFCTYVKAVVVLDGVTTEVTDPLTVTRLLAQLQVTNGSDGAEPESMPEEPEACTQESHTNYSTSGESQGAVVFVTAEGEQVRYDLTPEQQNAIGALIG